MADPATPVKLRAARAEDVEDLLRLKARVFGGMSLADERRRWDWQFDLNPACAPDWVRATVAEDEGGLLGYFAHVPMAVDIGARVGLAADGVDLCLDPRARGRGLGRRLARPMWQAGFCDFPFAAGLNEASRHLFTEAGGVVVGAPEEVVGHAYFVHDTHPPVPAGLPTERIDDFGEDCDALWAASAGSHRKLALRRDAAYLRWRYRDFPFAPCEALRARDPAGRTRGLAVLQKDAGLDRSYLLEMICPPGDPDTLRGLLRAAVEWADRSGTATLYHGTRDRTQTAALVAADFRPVPGDVPNFVGKLHDAADARVEDWWVSLGDGDPLYQVGGSPA